MYQPRLSVVNHQTNVAVIGCGYWGMNYVRVLSELPDSRVTVVCDERAGRLDEVARRFPDVQLTTSIEEALDDDAVEAAVICTRPRRIARSPAGRWSSASTSWWRSRSPSTWPRPTSSSSSRRRSTGSS